MVKHYNVMVIGEQHNNPKHAMKEAEAIRTFRPNYILFEGFVDYPSNEIKEFIDECINSDINSVPEDIKPYIPVFKAMQESGAIVEGCDSKELQDEWDNNFEITPDDYAKGVDHVLRKAEELRKTLRKRNMYMINKIVQYSRKGKTLVIVGKGHLEEIVKELNKYDDIDGKALYLE